MPLYISIGVEFYNGIVWFLCHSTAFLCIGLRQQLTAVTQNHCDNRKSKHMTTTASCGFAEHSSAITRRSEEARPHQARAAESPSLASRPTARPVQVVSADVQGAPWSGTAVYRRSLPASYISRQ